MLFFARLRFAHAWLWKRDETYRLAAVLGPPVLLGLALAGGVTHEAAAIRAGTAPAWLTQGWAKVATPIRAVFGAVGPFASGANAPWAQPMPAGGMPQDGTPTVLAPAVPMPQDGPASVIARLKPGWRGVVLPVIGTDNFDVGVGTEPEGVIALNRPALDIAGLLVAAPAQGRHVIGAEGVVMIPADGRYRMSLRINRGSGAKPAACLSQLIIDHRLALSEGRLGFGEGTETYRPVTLDLKAGFYRVGVVFGCWRDGKVDLPGTLNLLLSAPGDTELSPIKAGDLFHTTRN